MFSRRGLLGAGAALATAAVARPLRADDFPSRQVKIVVPFPPGGGVDIVARLLAQDLSTRLGQQFFVENLAGGSGVLGSSTVARAKPDGYTLICQTSSSGAANPATMRNLPYDSHTAFAPVSQIASMPLMLYVNAKVPAQTIGEWIALLKAAPGKYTYGSSGVRTVVHLAAELFRIRAGVDILHVPYRGTGPAAAALSSGEISMLVDSIGPQRPFIASGAVRPLATVAGRRAKGLPDVPTLAESGFAGFDLPFWSAVFAPAGTPPAIVDKLSGAIAAGLRSELVSKRMDDLGFEPVGSTPAALDAVWKSDMALFKKIVEDAKIELE